MAARRTPVSLAFDTMQLAMEAGAVMALRGYGWLSGSLSPREASRMIAEKGTAMIAAGTAASLAMLAGRPERAMPATVAIYRRAARANRARLSRDRG